MELLHCTRNKGILAAFLLAAALIHLAPAQTSFASVAGYSIQVVDTAGIRVLRFNAAGNAGMRYVHDLDIALDTSLSCTASLAVSPDGRVPAVWPSIGRVFYAGTLQPASPASLATGDNPGWTHAIRVSPRATGPATGVEIKTEGEMLYLTWRSPMTSRPGESMVWRRVALAEPGSPPSWPFPPVCISYPSGR